MNDEEPDDLPTALTRLLRNVQGVHTVYATRSPIPTIVTAVVELVKNDLVGSHLITVREDDDHIEVSACIGVLGDEPAPDICRRAFEAIDEFITSDGDTRSRTISVAIGRVG